MQANPSIFISMIVYINDKAIRLEKAESFSPSGHFDVIVDHATTLDSLKLFGNLLIYDDTPQHLEALLALMQNKKLRKLESVTYVTNDYKAIKDHLKSRFKKIKAAGGLVVKDGKVLMIHRLQRWDLPKGKLERDEETDVAAVREVEEECGVNVKLVSKLCHTWHTYLNEGSQTLKKTTWYLMECTDDSQMKPQVEEGIVDVRWLGEVELEVALMGTFGTIKDVFTTWKSGISADTTKEIDLI